MARRSSYLEEACALVLVLLTAVLVGTLSVRDVSLAAQAAPQTQYGPIRIHIDPNNPPQHLVINLGPVGGATVSMSSMPAQPSLPVVQAWTRALTDAYYGRDGDAVTQARAALARLTGNGDEDRFMRAEIALVLVQAARRAGEEDVARTAAATFAAQVRAILADPHATAADKQAARGLEPDLTAAQR